ncbi:MAG: hypothetical protein WDN72_08415 [Alphaproteobacteria bacterium]
MKRALAASLLLFCGLPGTVAAKQPGVAATVENFRAIGPDQVILLADGRQAVLAGIVFPDAYLATRSLAPLAGKSMPCRVPGADRYGRLRLVPLTGSAASLQDALLRDGVAVRSGAEDDAGWAVIEAQARRAHRGVWGEKDFVLGADHAGGHRGEFHVVEGTVKRVYFGHDATELNFGDDWRTDFSVAVPRKVARDLDTDDLEGAQVRVRGVLFEKNGPMLLLGNAAQLEIVHGVP